MSVHKIAAIYVAKIVLQSPSSVKLSHFLLAASQNAIQEVIIYDNKAILFKGLADKRWFYTNGSVLTKDRLFRLLLKNPQIGVNCKSMFSFYQQAVVGKMKSLFRGASMWLYNSIIFSRIFWNQFLEAKNR